MKKKEKKRKEKKENKKQCTPLPFHPTMPPALPDTWPYMQVWWAKGKAEKARERNGGEGRSAKQAGCASTIRLSMFDLLALLENRTKDVTLVSDAATAGILTARRGRCRGRGLIE